MAFTEELPAQLDKVSEELTCPICLEVAQLPVNFVCFRGCGGRFAAGATCLRSVLCMQCANDALQLGRPPAERFPAQGGAAACLICRTSTADARSLTPESAYAPNHNVMAIMDVLGMGGTCRRCDEDCGSQAALLHHYLRRCPAAVVRCRFRGCAAWHTRAAAAAHEDTCPVGRCRCSQCGCWVDRPELLRHTVSTCRLRIVSCVLCGHTARLPDMLGHLRLHQSHLQAQGQGQGHAKSQGQGQGQGQAELTHGSQQSGGAAGEARREPGQAPGVMQATGLGAGAAGAMAAAAAALATLRAQQRALEGQREQREGRQVGEAAVAGLGGVVGGGSQHERGGEGGRGGGGTQLQLPFAAQHSSNPDVSLTPPQWQPPLPSMPPAALTPQQAALALLHPGSQPPRSVPAAAPHEPVAGPQASPQQPAGQRQTMMEWRSAAPRTQGQPAQSATQSQQRHAHYLQPLVLQQLQQQQQRQQSHPQPLQQPQQQQQPAHPSTEQQLQQQLALLEQLLRRRRQQLGQRTQELGPGQGQAQAPSQEPQPQAIAAAAASTSAGHAATQRPPGPQELWRQSNTEGGGLPGSLAAGLAVQLLRAGAGGPVAGSHAPAAGSALVPGPAPPSPGASALSLSPVAAVTSGVALANTPVVAPAVATSHQVEPLGPPSGSSSGRASSTAVPAAAPPPASPCSASPWSTVLSPAAPGIDAGDGGGTGDSNSTRRGTVGGEDLPDSIPAALLRASASSPGRHAGGTAADSTGRDVDFQDRLRRRAAFWLPGSEGVPSSQSTSNAGAVVGVSGQDGNAHANATHVAAASGDSNAPTSPQAGGHIELAGAQGGSACGPSSRGEEVVDRPMGHRAAAIPRTCEVGPALAAVDASISLMRRSFSDTELMYDVLEELVRASANAGDRAGARASVSGC